MDYVTLVNGVEVVCMKCKTCNIFRPPRSFHCSSCGACIEVHDHHCAFIGTCIGKRNHRYFLLFCLFTTIIALFSLVINIFVYINLELELE